VALATTGVHVLTLLGELFVRFDVFEPMFPSLSSNYSFTVQLGVLAVYGALLAHKSFSRRKHINAKPWRSLHYVAFSVLAAALLHGLLVGSNSGTPGIQTLFISSAAVVMALGLLRALGPATRAESRRLAQSPRPDGRMLLN